VSKKDEWTLTEKKEKKGSGTPEMRRKKKNRGAAMGLSRSVSGFLAREEKKRGGGSCQCRKGKEGSAQGRRRGEKSTSPCRCNVR